MYYYLSGYICTYTYLHTYRKEIEATKMEKENAVDCSLAIHLKPFPLTFINKTYKRTQVSQGNITGYKKVIPTYLLVIDKTNLKQVFKRALRKVR